MTWIRWYETQSGGYPTAAVAVAVPYGSHTGVVYSDDDGMMQFIHLAFHHRLQRDTLANGIGWVSPANAIPPERLAHVAAMCDRIWERHEKSGLPYGFRYDATCFHSDGKVELGPDECGLTCATFVLAVYRSVGLELLKIEDWPTRDDDEQRFNQLLDLLKKTRADQKHIDAVAKETKSARYRPMEVAAGSGITPPASFDNATAGAAAIEKELSVLPPVPPEA